MSSPRFVKSRRRRPPSPAQRAWLIRGLDQPGGKLPLFDVKGGEMRRRIVDACLTAGWAERWFDNPLKPDWLVCRLTDAGRAALATDAAEAPADEEEKEDAS
jgi:hypothetical protein